MLLLLNDNSSLFLSCSQTSREYSSFYRLSFKITFQGVQRSSSEPLSFTMEPKPTSSPEASQPPPKTWWWSYPQPPIIFFSKFFSSLGLRAQPSTVFLGSHSLSLFSAIFLSVKVNIRNVDTIYICNPIFFQGLRSTSAITHKTFYMDIHAQSSKASKPKTSKLQPLHYHRGKVLISKCLEAYF